MRWPLSTRSVLLYRGFGDASLTGHATRTMMIAVIKCISLFFFVDCRDSVLGKSEIERMLIWRYLDSFTLFPSSISSYSSHPYRSIALLFPFRGSPFAFPLSNSYHSALTNDCKHIVHFSCQYFLALSPNIPTYSECPSYVWTHAPAIEQSREQEWKINLMVSEQHLFIV